MGAKEYHILQSQHRFSSDNQALIIKHKVIRVKKMNTKNFLKKLSSINTTKKCTEISTDTKGYQILLSVVKEMQNISLCVDCCRFL